MQRRTGGQFSCQLARCSPVPADHRRSPNEDRNMTVVRGFAITIASGIAFALLGAGAGFLLGTLAPDYYRTVFRIPPDVSIDPAQAGLGLGLTQGLVGGLGIGLVIVMSVAWYNSKIAVSPIAPTFGHERTDLPTRDLGEPRDARESPS